MEHRTLEDCIAEVATELLTTGTGRTNNDEIVAVVKARYPEVIAAERERLVNDEMGRMVHEIITGRFTE